MAVDTWPETREVEPLRHYFDERTIRCVRCRRPSRRMSKTKLREHLEEQWRRSWKRKRGRPCVPRPFFMTGEEKGYRCSTCGYVTVTWPKRPRLKRSPNGVRRCTWCRRVPKGRPKASGKLHKNGLCDLCNEIKQRRRCVLKCRRQRRRKRLALAEVRRLDVQGTEHRPGRAVLQTSENA